MDWIRLGRAIRALRIRRGWRQVDLAAAAAVSQPLVSLVERGHGDRVTGEALYRIARALDARLVVRLDWKGEALDRLLDRDHAALVEAVVRILRNLGWMVEPEVTFAIGGERGSIDMLAWHAKTGTLLVVEVKSVIPDAQEALSRLDRKVRLAPRIGADRGWRPVMVARLLVIGDTRTSRRRVEALGSTFDARFPDRRADTRRFLADPGGWSHGGPDGRSFSGLWFLTVSNQARLRHRVPRRTTRAERGPEPISGPAARKSAAHC